MANITVTLTETQVAALQAALLHHSTDRARSGADLGELTELHNVALLLNAAKTTPTAQLDASIDSNDVQWTGRPSWMRNSGPVGTEYC